MSNDMTPNQPAMSIKELNQQIVGTTSSTDDVFGAVAKASSFLPRLQLFTSASNECKKGEFPLNHYGVVTAKNRIRDLGKTVEVVPLAWRPKAMQIMADGTILSKYDAKDPEFGRIAEMSDIQNSGCMFGPEFLLWVPGIKGFVTFFMSSKSARNEAPALKDKLDQEQAATLDSTFLSNKKFSWQSPVIRGCSTPLDLPAGDSLITEITKFKNPPKDEIEAAEPAGATAAARPR